MSDPWASSQSRLLSKPPIGVWQWGLGFFGMLVLYFASLGPAQVLANRAMRVPLPEHRDILYGRWYYFRPAFTIMTPLPAARKSAARYVHWWVTVTRTPRMIRSSDEWYDE